MSPVAAPPHVTLSGDIEGRYVVADQRPNGELRLVPDREWTAWDERLASHGERRATPEEWQAFLAEYGPHMQPPDGEG
jgi:hypothetical protein